MWITGLMRWIVEEARVKLNHTIHPEEWTLVYTDRGMPLQVGGSDCGVFAVMVADYISDDLPLSFNQTNVSHFRQKIGTDILRNKLNYPHCTVPIDLTSE